MATTVDYIAALQQETITFDFTEASNGAKAPFLNDMVTKKAAKTGTTICGIVCKDGLVLAADARATAGPMVFTKDCEKVDAIAPNIACAGAGTAADLYHVTQGIRFDLALYSRTIKRLPKTETAIRRLQEKLFKYQGYVSCALIVGGVNADGSRLLSFISPDGYTYEHPYMAMGSGGYFASSVLQANWRPDITVEEGKELCADAIEAGIRNDMGSGSHVDVVVIRSSAPTQQERTLAYRKPIF
eukprot:Protomagalhaensia_wolfi_Nauph_80__5541@NODE_609_length_2213_cov_1214_203772_g457_i0_p2_GENE_NODE_609_length_2213_cov_1214_203772_g457_i0NODE_609_length_2213_cov_1214_203772_g457_i0_p2_ORF_typecomplete_len243_score58_93Proteasome/PF00227_26/8_5e42DUF5494/PF17598_2/0_012_NODE_609_length_2213_cov_1214_203772_g457_i014212149